jgi:hypothetical protein
MQSRIENEVNFGIEVCTLIQKPIW